ncbi:PREDICTED: uncharacterized protein At2g24330-like [Nelumbo nucifera]|uniref:Uncharacterized protein At2g24330-like n=1 Tax=Nelumbo nucifera TaxID=4432 RepID=A0A1U8B9Z3_NELNU|nr:PREDICTED: uncharacterized protein At2g24330-like [Nelumbo nucifera]XP_010273204.1 PREDICTED: uncharacterized protein At2g24330-like [Nelumbo nucifera]XP_010273205.1 PREDICTED: uncharacterized protein At2g24330-like [Nelumbo nucifera]XP_019055239.1 PREDICTED: uncharacterized protein At2g24330-like [Nelumbo nucifera]
MADDAKEGRASGENNAVSNDTKKGGETIKKQRRGILSRVWGGIFRIRGEDFEKRLEHISKEETSVLARMKRRSHSWRRTARNIIVFSVVLEVVAVSYAIMTTRALDLNWKMRALRVLPMFLLPALSFLVYSTLVNFTRMLDRKDQKTLERLRAERQAKIDELKERTNYYTTQQLIQRYDPDPAAKAAAATVLASKLGADSGLKLYVGDSESKINVASVSSNDIELVQSSGLRNRKKPQVRSGSAVSMMMNQPIDETQHDLGVAGAESPMQNQMVVQHHPRSTMQDGGWIARIAALLVGEDPTQSYALICGNCHMHNGLARKEDFPYITYYCPHCHALNRSAEQKEHDNGSSSTNISSPTTPTSGDVVKSVNSATTESKLMTSEQTVAVPTAEGSETKAHGDEVN